MKVFAHSSAPPKASGLCMAAKECRRIGETVEKWMRGLQKSGPKGGGGAKCRRGKKSELALAIPTLQHCLKRGPGYLPLTPGAIKRVACFECKTCGNDRLLGRNAIRCEAGGPLHVVHRRAALHYVTGRVKRPRDWMVWGREVLIAWEFNFFSFCACTAPTRPCTTLSYTF